MLNHITLMGRLTRDPELKYTQTNLPVCTITLACERDYAPQGAARECDFIDVVCWRHTAEFVAKYFRKGLLVAASGRLQTRKWVDKFQQNRVTVEVVAESCYFAERADAQAAAKPAPAKQYAADPTPPGWNPRAADVTRDPADALFRAMEAGGGLPVSDFAGFLDDEDDVPF